MDVRRTIDEWLDLQDQLELVSTNGLAARCRNAEQFAENLLYLLDQHTIDSAMDREFSSLKALIAGKEVQN